MTCLWLGLVTLVDCFSRIIVRMANYNQTTQEIARPSELLVAIAAYTTSLQSLSSYINVDVTRLVKSVLLQQTRPQDGRGAPTITTLYTNWCACHIFYGIAVNTYITIKVCCHCKCKSSSLWQVQRIFFCYFLFYLCFSLFVFFSVNLPALMPCLILCLSGSWRACCVKPATLSSSTALRCTALSTRAQTTSRFSERRSFQM